MSVEHLITENIDIWTSAIKTKSASQRGSSNKLELYGIKKLRELILQMAYSGKLFNDSLEEDFDSVLSDFKKQKESFHKIKGVRIQAFKRLHDEYKLPGLPSNWKECFLDEVITYITDFQANGSFSTLKSNVKYYDTKNYALLVRLTDLRHGLTNDSNYKYTDEHGYNFLNKSSVHGGELVIANVGAGVGTTLLVPELNMPATLAPNMFMVVLPETIDKDYFLYFSQSPQYWAYLNSVNTGTGQPKINKTEYKNCKFPLAPLEVQKNIVSKIKELMALCDQLESQTEASIEAHQTLVKTLLETLTNAKDADELDESWQRISEHFDVLFTTEDSIDQLKQTILQLAVMGKLVKQDPSDEPVLSLFDRIEVARNERICKKEIQKPKKVTVSDELEADFPDAWKTSLLNDLVFVTKLAGFEYTKYFDLKDKGEIPVIRAQNVRPFKPSKENLKYLDKQTSEMLPRSALDRPSLLVTFIGAGIGDVCIFNETTRWHLAPNVAKVEPFADVNLDFLCIYLNSPLGRNQLFKSMKSTAQPSLSMTTIREIWVPIPPVEEQQRIVVKVDELMSLCDTLKIRLKDANGTQLHLTDAIVEQVS